MSDLEAHRDRIRRIDEEIVRLVGERMSVARAAGEAKRSAGIPLRDFEVERLVLDRAAAAADAAHVPADVVRGLMQVLVAASRDEQERASYSSFSGTAEHIAVVGGAGRMGRWFVDFFENQGHRVTVVERGDDLVAGVGEASIALLATTPDATRGVIAALAGAGYRGVVCDIASLKGHLRDAVGAAVEAGLAVTSIHPMFGPGARILSDKVICVCDCGVPEATERVRALFADTAATLVPLDFEEHDRIVSFVLGLSHLVNLLFAKVLAGHAGGFAAIDAVGSTTFHAQVHTTETVAGEDPDLYFEIQRLNQFTPGLYAAVREELDELTGWVGDGDRDAFAAMMERSRAWLAGGRSSGEDHESTAGG
jgi:chorismate mutase/prephenate dehydrogenase